MMNAHSPLASQTIPSHIKPEAVVDYDMFGDSRFRETGDLHQGLFKLAAEEGRGIHWTPRNGGHWFINDHELLFQAARNPELFSNNGNVGKPDSDGAIIMIPPLADGSEPSFGPVTLDPPRHGAFRMPLMKVFAPNEIMKMEAGIRTAAAGLIDALAPHGRGEFVDAIGEPLPVTVFMKMMGMPLARLAEFRSWVNDLASDNNEKRVAAFANVDKAMGELVAARQMQREDDMVSRLIDSDIDGRPPTTEEMKAYCLLLFNAGLDTLVNGITFGMCHLAVDPDLQDRIRADRSLIPELIEEVLRRYAVTMLPRIVAHDAEFGGVQLKAGERVLLMLPAGNMDPAAFPDPMRFDIDREDKAHMTFNSGPHRCVGSHLVRLEMRVFYEEWFARMPNVHLDPDEPPAYRPGFTLSICKLPLVWDPAGTNAGVAAS
jgi:cytochrome P450